MKLLKHASVLLMMALLVAPMGASAQIKGLFGAKDAKKGEGGTDVSVENCSERIGTAALQEPEYPVYHQLGLKSPIPLVKLMMTRSGCFQVVARGQTIRALKAEREFAADGEGQKGSRMGGGQMVLADYIIVPNIVHQDSDSGGAGGVAGGILRRATGGLVGGFKTTKKEAQVMLEVVDTRTSVQVAAVEGSALKKDLKIGLGGWLGAVGGAGGGYDDTDIGKLTAVAFVDAYNKLTAQLGRIEAGSAKAADNAGYVTAADVNMRAGASENAPVLQKLYKGTSVIPTGTKSGVWWQVESQGQEGWVHGDYITR